MKTDFRLVILVLLAWTGFEALAQGSYIDSPLSFEKTPPIYAAPNNAHPSLEQLIGTLEERTRQQPDAAENWYQLGLAYAQASRTHQAVLALQKAVALDPDYVPGWENLGVNLDFDHQPDKAVDAFNKAVQLGASDPEVWNALGVVLIELNRLQECEDDLDQGFKLTSQSRRLWNTQGMLRQKQGRDQEALYDFQQTLRIDPNDAAGWNNLGVTQSKLGSADAITSYQNAVRLNPKLVPAWSGLAGDYLARRNFDAAIASAQHWLDLAPDDTAAWRTLAQCASYRQNWEQAVEYYHHSIDILGLGGVFTDRRDIALEYADYGYSCSNIGHYADADKLLQEAVAIDSTCIEAWDDLGYLRMLQGRSQEALAIIQKSLAVAPNQANALVTLGSIYGDYLQQPAEAEKAYQKAVAIQPSYSGAWLGLGKAEQLLQKREEAAQAYRKALEFTPTFVEAWQGLAATTSDPQEADRAIAKAISLDPKNATTRSMQGAIFGKRQDWSGAEKALRQNLTIANDSSPNWTMLGYALFKQHRFAEAADAELKAIQYDTSSSPEQLAADWGCLAEAYMAQTHEKGAPEWEASLYAIKHATDLNPTNSSYWYETVLCDRALGRQEDAGVAVSKWRTYGSLIPRLPGINDVTPAAPSSPAPSSGAASSAALAEANAIRTMVQNHQFEEAISEAQKNTQTRPADPLGWYELGDVFMNMKRYEEAISCLTNATTLEPKMGPAWFDLGNSLAYQGKFDDAIAALIKSIDNMPGYPLSWQALDECYVAKQDRAGGENKVRELLQSHPDCGYAWCALGDIESPGGTPDASLEALQKAVALQPNYAHAWNSLGLTYIKSHPDKALESFRRAIKEDPTDPEAWNNLGFTSYTAGKTTEAIDAYKHALQFSPRHLLALYNLVVAYAEQQQWDLARQTCNVLAEVNPAQAAQLRQRFPNIGVASAPAVKSVSP